jgi:hypothetical protein
LVFRYEDDLKNSGAMSSVYLLQDGFIVSSYDLIDPPNTATNYWNPGDGITPASTPYPRSNLEVLFHLYNAINNLPLSQEILTKIKYSKPLKVAGRLVMFCAEAAKEVQKSAF